MTTTDQDHEPLAVLKERREHELSVATAGPVPTLADLRRLVRAADQVGTPDSAELTVEGHRRQLRLREIAIDRSELPTDPDPGDFLVRIALTEDQPPEKTAREIADALRWHGRQPPGTGTGTGTESAVS